MMNRTEKLLQKLSASARYQIEDVLIKLYANKLEGLNVKKIEGSKDIYRLRVGRYRIIYRQSAGSNELISVTLRNEKTYKGL
jgi:mRNA-degrading endonuclease RelE of RelBE toxin-antitoxin system